MLFKKGINTTREEKTGPTVKQGITTQAHKKVVKCPNCKAVLEKSCSSAMVCEISTMKCPKCGTMVS